MTTLPDKNPQPEEVRLRKKSTEEICKYIADWTGRPEPYALLGRHELNRRLRQPDAVRSWFAIIISIVSIFVSILQRWSH